MTGEIRTARVAGPAPPLPRCADCGERLPTDAKFCPACGVAIGVAIAPLATHRSTRVSLGFISGVKFGAGFVIGAGLVGLAASLLGLVLAASLIGAMLSGLTKGSADLITDPHRFDGTGAATSVPIRLSGTVDVEWSANTTSTEGCWHRAAVTREDRAINSETVVDQQITQATSGTYVLRGLPDARYLIDVGSTCSWSFRLKPRS